MYINHKQTRKPSSSRAGVRTASQGTSTPKNPWEWSTGDTFGSEKRRNIVRPTTETFTNNWDWRKSEFAVQLPNENKEITTKLYSGKSGEIKEYRTFEAGLRNQSYGKNFDKGIVHHPPPADFVDRGIESENYPSVYRREFQYQSNSTTNTLRTPSTELPEPSSRKGKGIGNKLIGGIAVLHSIGNVVTAAVEGHGIQNVLAHSTPIGGGAEFRTLEEQQQLDRLQAEKDAAASNTTAQEIVGGLTTAAEIGALFLL